MPFHLHLTIKGVFVELARALIVAPEDQNEKGRLALSLLLEKAFSVTSSIDLLASLREKFLNRHLTPRITGKINLQSEAAQLYFVRVHALVRPFSSFT